MKKYLFTLPAISSLAALPVVASQVSADTQGGNGSQTYTPKNSDETIALTNGLLESSLKLLKANMITTVAKTTNELKEISASTGINIADLGAATTATYLQYSNQVATEAEAAIKSKRLDTAVSKVIQLNEFTSSLASDYYAAKQIGELFKLAKDDVRTQLISQAHSVYETVKAEYAKLAAGASDTSTSTTAIEPPIQLLASGYANKLTSLLNTQNDNNKTQIEQLNNQIQESNKQLETIKQQAEEYKTQLEELKKQLAQKDSQTSDQTNSSISDVNKPALIATSTATGILFLVVLGLIIYIVVKRK
ncbi:hypothetical protein MM26B8_02190 [Mycoplasmopsis meleagridis]|uniref:Uncharacterized protein n=1 Tax=Mycoplasmopsis meleagridis ATCC 25294 TaxID=1264554 RepID=A0A0F5H155_9BACT|nr:hypothetical protein [Mycoplasmopsis meleagridis]KKB27036.1 hypothetical protein MMELEA_02940 [Mycoplasmopsis meleagridis ATCC 25294]OAD18417.1 hypothetical protein MM26B8_02190 [Mycoplasmopsis meleagridis]VEU77520.1 Uncharacterised protein [Mycoplasmopsis meleagridis]